MFLTQCPPPAGGPELPPLANDDPLSRIEQYALLAAQRAITYCNPQEMLVRTKIGHVVCSPNDLAVISYLSGGDPEPGTRMLIEKLLQPGDTYIDVGANLGIHTLAAARAMKNSGRIIAFEPFPETAKLLKKTMFINGGSSIFELHEAAVSNIEGKQRLYLGQTCGHHSLFAHDESGQNSLNQIEVKVVKLDDILPETTRPTLIKIDAEGAELSVIEGAHSLLSRNPDVALIAEFGRPHLVLTGQSPSNWLRRFEDLGFFCRKINADTGALESFSCVDSMDSETANLVFARRNSVAWNRLAFSRCAA